MKRYKAVSDFQTWWVSLDPGLYEISSETHDAALLGWIEAKRQAGALTR